jgi:hypothetical protein
MTQRHIPFASSAEAAGVKARVAARARAVKRENETAMEIAKRLGADGPPGEFRWGFDEAGLVVQWEEPAPAAAPAVAGTSEAKS